VRLIELLLQQICCPFAMEMEEKTEAGEWKAMATVLSRTLRIASAGSGYAAYTQWQAIAFIL